jgi:hypothetical protein
MPPLPPLDSVWDICVWGANRTRWSVKVLLRGMSPDPVSFHISFMLEEIQGIGAL